MAGIKLNKGLQPFDLYFEDIDKHETIYFNPSDSDLVSRLAKSVENIKNLLIDFKTNPDDDAYKIVEKIDETEKTICNEIDYGFGNKVSDTVFKHCGVMSVVNGEFYILTFFDAILPEIKKMSGGLQRQASSNTQKYINKWRKK